MDLDALSPAAALPELLSVRRITDAEAELLECRGELDLATGPVLRSKVRSVLEDRPRRLVIDLCGVGFVDSSGLAVVLEVARQAHERGIDLRFACDVPSTLRLLELTGTDRVLSVQPTRSQALQLPHTAAIPGERVSGRSR